MNLLTNMEPVVVDWLKIALGFGIKVVVAFIIFLVGRWLIGILTKWVKGLMQKRDIDKGVVSFLDSALHILLYVLLFVGILSYLGFEVVSFAALLASAGVAIGMALSNDLKNLAGGIVLLVTRPIRVGDVVQAEGYSGTVTEIRIFHTLITLFDNSKVFIPNGVLSGASLLNYSMSDTRRIDRTVSIKYGTDYEKARQVIETIIARDPRYLKSPEPIIVLDSLSSKSVDIAVKVWAAADDYWPLLWDFTKEVYAEFNKVGIPFPAPAVAIINNTNE